MQYIVPIGIGVGSALVVMWALSRHRREEMRRLRESVKQMRNDFDLMQAKLRETQFIDLDLSSMETRVEESAEQLQILVQQEAESLMRRIDDLEERVGDLEAELEESYVAREHP